MAMSPMTTAVNASLSQVARFLFLPLDLDRDDFLRGLALEDVFDREDVFFLVLAIYSVSGIVVPAGPNGPGIKNITQNAG